MPAQTFHDRVKPKLINLAAKLQSYMLELLEEHCPKEILDKDLQVVEEEGDGKEKDPVQPSEELVETQEEILAREERALAGANDYITAKALLQVIETLIQSADRCKLFTSLMVQNYWLHSAKPEPMLNWDKMEEDKKPSFEQIEGLLRYTGKASEEEILMMQAAVAPTPEKLVPLLKSYYTLLCDFYLYCQAKQCL